MAWSAGFSSGGARRRGPLRRSGARTEPAADAETVALRGQHRVLAPRREKAHQAAGDGLDVPMTPGSMENPQLASRDRRPVLVQVQEHRHLALAASLRLIDVPGISGARRITGIVQLEIEQAETGIAIELQSKMLEFPQQRPLRRQQRRRYPAG